MGGGRKRVYTKHLTVPEKITPDVLVEDDPKITHLENTLELIKKTDKLFALGSPQIMQQGRIHFSILKILNDYSNSKNA